MGNTETSPSELPTISSILIYLLILVFRFPHISCVSDMILKEFGFEFIPDNQLGLSLVGLSMTRVWGLLNLER